MAVAVDEREVEQVLDTGQPFLDLRPRARSPASYLLLPGLLALALFALYAWVGAQELDSIERRFLTAPVLTAATVRHVEITVLVTVFIVVLAVPAGIVLTRPFARRVAPMIIGLANAGQSVPSIGVIALLALVWTIGLRTAVVAIVAYGLLPVLRNTMVGLQQVDRAVIEAGRGMGMTKRGVLARIELPLAVPVILAGVRTALVIAVGTAALATFVNGGGLGDIINQGLVQRRFPITLTGGVLVAVLALLIDWSAGIAEDALRPKGL
ncbi:MAG TPA: ABC transporter permease [Egibacteraceae bacterium]|nr:ABC transporter permease [Egibacteraceae bacterium]